MESATARMLKLAGFQRLLSQINTDEPVVDQTHIMRLAEERLYAYTKTLEPKQLRSTPQPILMQIEDILRPFQFKFKPSFLALWDFVLTGAGEPPQIKTHLELIKSVSHNNRLKRLILPQLQTNAKYSGIVKHILNLGKEFQSLFDEVELTSTEIILRTSAKLEESAMQSSLDLFLTKQTFESDEEALIQQFYGCVAKLSDPTLRNTYFNRLLNQILQTVKATSLTPHLTNLFVLFYDRLVNHELVTTVDPVITKWLSANPIAFFTHSMSKLAMLLPPYTPFQKAAITLDSWQRDGLQAMRRGESIFLDVPTSGGKTLAASEAINIYDNVLYIMPEKPLVEQFTSIAVATLTDAERRGNLERNVRQEVNDSSRPYRRFPSRKDNIVIGQPRRIYELLHNKSLTTAFQCVVLDEFHNLSDPEHGVYYQYILFWAAMRSLPVVAMTATLRNGPEIAAEMSKIVNQPLFAVHLKKRFFNQRRMVFRVEGDKITLVTVNPLDHLRLDTLKSPHFRHPGLVPGEVLRLYNNVTSFPRMDERKAHVPTLDDVEGIEEALFEHVAKQPPEILATLIKESPVAGDQLTPYQIVTTLRSINDEHKPLLLFKSDPLQNLAFHKLLFVDLLTEENKLVYGNFQDDQPILEDYFQALEDLHADEEEGGGDGEKAEKHREIRRKQREALFNSKFLPKLLKFDEAYVNPTPDPKRLEAFNAKFGATLTHAYIVRKRKEHIEEQSRTYDTVCLRPEYTIHRKIKISAYSNGAIMKEIKNLIETELSFQRRQTGAFPLMQTFGPEFAAYDNIVETRYWTRWNQEKHKHERTGIQETHRIDQPWPSSRQDNDELDYSYEISYDHPILLGIECGILFNNALLNPAFIYICQYLISKHPLVVLSCKSYATGVNFPFKTVWVQGSFKGEPLESLPNALVWQMMGRGGRRGLFRLATGIYSGIETSHVMFPEFKPIAFNSFEAMAPLLEGEDEEFVTFVKTGKRPEPKTKADIHTVKNIVTPLSKRSSPTVTSESKSPVAIDEAAMASMTWEEMAAFLEGE